MSKYSPNHVDHQDNDQEPNEMRWPLQELRQHNKSKCVEKEQGEVKYQGTCLDARTLILNKGIIQVAKRAMEERE